MRANRAGDDWAEVGGYCLNAVRAAALAHLATQGRFDPRVLRALLRLGYTRSRESGRSGGPIPARHAAAPSEVWLPDIDADAGRVRIGPDPVDLGGIGKGLALRWAAERVARVVPVPADRRGRRHRRARREPRRRTVAHRRRGPPRRGRPDRRARRDRSRLRDVLDPARRWQHQGETVHHLVDPRTGRPGGAGLLAVTVVAATRPTPRCGPRRCSSPVPTASPGSPSNATWPRCGCARTARSASAPRWLRT